MSSNSVTLPMHGNGTECPPVFAYFGDAKVQLHSVYDYTTTEAGDDEIYTFDVIKDGKVTSVFTEPGMKDYITMFADWYQKGLVDRDFATHGATAFSLIQTDNVDFYRNQGGAYITVYSFTLDSIPGTSSGDAVRYDVKVQDLANGTYRFDMSDTNGSTPTSKSNFYDGMPNGNDFVGEMYMTIDHDNYDEMEFVIDLEKMVRRINYQHSDFNQANLNTYNGASYEDVLKKKKELEASGALFKFEEWDQSWDAQHPKGASISWYEITPQSGWTPLEISDIHMIEGQWGRIGQQWLKAAGSPTYPLMGLTLCFSVVGLDYFFRRRKKNAALSAEA